VSDICDVEECQSESIITSRLSPDGFLVATGKQAYSFREAYVQFNYCKSCHVKLMAGVWSRVNDSSDKNDDHVAPTAI